MAKKTRIEDIDSEAVINSFRLDDTSIPPEARSTDGNAPVPPPKEAIQEAVSPPASHSKEEPERRRRNSKPEKLDYDTVFICGSNITARLGKQVYIRKEYHDRIQKMLHVIGGNEVTIAAFLDNVLTHWKIHSTLTLLATQDLPTFGYNMIAPLKSWCWGSILFYPFNISRFS